MQGPDSTTTDAHTEALRHRVPGSLWESMNDEQRRLTLGMLAAQQTRHAVDYRVSVPTGLWGSWYVVVLAGSERRNAARLTEEAQTSASRRAGFFAGLIALVVTYAAFGLIAFAYLMKSMLGIDFADDASLLHPLYELFVSR